VVNKPTKKPGGSRTSLGTMTDDNWPIGMLPDGSLNVVDATDPPFEPTLGVRSEEQSLHSREARSANDPTDLASVILPAVLSELRRLAAESGSKHGAISIIERHGPSEAGALPSLPDRDRT
jgi:hypothetical protein